jgi:hypothetical protein
VHEAGDTLPVLFVGHKDEVCITGMWATSNHFGLQCCTSFWCQVCVGVVHAYIVS